MRINKPFIFGTAIGRDHFIGREEEIQRLKANFTHGINTILMSPRRWGKTSLVKRVMQEVESDDLHVIFIDIFSCRDEYDFYNKFAASLLKQSGRKFDEWKSLVSDFLVRLSPKISYSVSPSDEISISLGITPHTHSPEDVLSLPQVLAEKIGKHLLVCIDEFQQIGEFANSLVVQKRMRSIWQHQTNVSYCLFGSKHHMMEGLFLSSSHPFYKFGDIVPIKTIPTETWIPYIQAGFSSEGKSIDRALAGMICERVNNHSSYVQQYAWLTLVITEQSADEAALDQALQSLIDENAALFVEQTSSLTTYQLNLLRAILDGVTTGFSLQSIRERYNLGSYSNIKRMLTALIEKEIIMQTSKETYIADPVLALWLKQTIW